MNNSILDARVFETENGLKCLKQTTREMNRKTWQHNELAEDLAIAKSSFYLDVPLGSVWLAPYGKGVPRADLVEIKPSYTRFCVSIYEVKVSRSDFLSDINSGKWRGYLPHCHRFYFATPAGLVDKREIPEEAGWIVRGERGWKTMKVAPVQQVEVPKETLLSLLFAKQRTRHTKQHRDLIGYRYSYSWERDDLYKTLGKELGDALRNKDEYERQKKKYERQKKKYEHIINQIEEAIREGLGEKRVWWPADRLVELVREIKEKAREVG